MNDQNTNQALTELSDRLKSGTLTKEQILSAIGETPKASTQKTLTQKIDLQRILYYLGGFIVLLGIILIIAQFWEDLGQISKTLVTLGSAISAYSLGYYFFTKTPSRDFGHAFFVISTALFPLGVGTALDALGISATQSGGASINAALLFLIFYVSYFTIKAEIFLPFSIIAASAFYFTFTSFLLFKNAIPISHFYEYQTFVLGITYLSLGYYFSTTKRAFVTDLLYFFGSIMTLGTGLVLQGFSPNVNIFWQMVYPFFLVLSFWASIKFQNKLFLILATIFTFAEILKLTTEYFSKSVGWPISLIISGLVIMGIGYMSFELNKKFLKRTSTASASDLKTSAPQETNKPPAQPNTKQTNNYLPLLGGLFVFFFLAIAVAIVFLTQSSKESFDAEVTTKPVNIPNNPPGYQTKIASPSAAIAPYTIAIETVGCQSLTCIIATRENITSPVTSFSSVDNIQPSAVYDVFVCSPNCGSGSTLALWNRKQCTSTSESTLTINTLNNTCY